MSSSSTRTVADSSKSAKDIMPLQPIPHVFPRPILPVRINPLPYVGPRQLGDLVFMQGIGDRPGYARIRKIYLFNDSTELHDSAHPTERSGVLRQFNIVGRPDKPEAFGIITGSTKKGAFKELNVEVQQILTANLYELICLIDDYKIQEVVFTSNPTDMIDNHPKWMSRSVSQMGPDVIDFVTRTLYGLGFYHGDCTDGSMY